MMYILSSSGRKVHNPPRSGDIDFSDIVLGCSRAHRFANQLPEGVTWTVAHHQTVAAALMDMWSGVPERTVPLAALHDAHEAYLGDLARPFKNESRRELERAFDSAIFEAAGITPDGEDFAFMRYVDRVCCVAEAQVLHGISDADIQTWDVWSPDLQPWDITTAKREVRWRFNDRYAADPDGYQDYKALLHRLGLV